MPTINGRNYSLNELQQLWLPIYANREQQLGATATLVNFGDQPNAGKVNASTFTGMKFNASGLSPVWTPSEALSAFDTPFDLTLASNWQGVIPTLAFNGTDERMTTPDAAFWTPALAAASWGAWVYNTGTGGTILAKYTLAGNLREWVFELTTNTGLRITLYDEDDAVTPNATIATYAATSVTASAWHFLVATYDGTANASGLDLYVDGALIASSDTDDANFASVRDYTAVVELGRANAADYFTGRMAGGPCSPFFVQAELTAGQIYNLYARERLALGV